MNKNILGATMLSLATFVANNCSAIDLNNANQDIEVFKTTQNDLKILKYSRISDNDLLNIWTSNDFKQKAIDNPKILSTFQNEAVEIKIHEFKKDNVLSFVIPYFETDNLSIDEVEKLLIKELSQTTSRQLPLDILARALTDIKFKEKVIKEPKTIFVDMGDIGEDSDYDIKIYQDTKEVRNVILPNSPINNDQLDMYKSKVAYFWRHQPCYDSPFDIQSDPYCMPIKEQYDTKSHIACTSLPTCPPDA